MNISKIIHQFVEKMEHVLFDKARNVTEMSLFQYFFALRES